MSFDISSIFDNKNSIDFLVSQYIKLESRPRNNIVENRNKLSERKKIISSLDSKLSSLNSISERLTDDITDYFSLKKAESSDKTLVSASTSSKATSGNHELTVERLARSDTRVSQQLKNSNYSFNSITSDQTFTIDLGNYYKDQNSSSSTYGESVYQRVNIDITLAASTFSQTNDEVLKSVALAINEAMGRALTTEVDYDGDGDNENKLNNTDIISANVVEEEDGMSRLILRSASSGYSYRMNFTDSSSGFLSMLEINSSSQSNGTAGGYITNIGTEITDSDLNAKFSLNGLTFYRDSNNITDALNGVTFSLLNTFTEPETITISPDVEGVKGEVQAFLDSFNENIEFLRENAQLDPLTGKKGILADDSLYRQLSSDLRYKFSSVVSDVSSSSYDRLNDIGIEPDRQGKYSITDTSKFTLALESNSRNVSDIFNSSTDGIATIINQFVDNYIKVGGSLDSSKSSIDDSISQLDTRISYWDDVLMKREIQLRDEFARIQGMMSQLQQQQNFFSTFSR